MIITEFLDSRNIGDEAKLAVSQSEIIYADNIVQYMDNMEKERWKIISDFPNTAPVFSDMAIVSKCPKCYGEDALAMVNLCQVLPDDWLPDDYDGWLMSMTSFVKWAPSSQFIKFDDVNILATWDECRWEEIHTVLFVVDAQGKPRGIMANQDGTLYGSFKGFYKKWQEWTAWVPLMSLSFMHCKNVTLDTVNPSDRLNHARIKRGRTPHLTYKVLDIHPMKRILAAEGRIAEVGLQKALHICRGHFKNFDDRPLFGKLRGQYWWDSHVRGDIKQGAVIKDYNIFAEVA